MNEDGRFDVGNVFFLGRAAIKGNGGGEIGSQTGCERVGDAAAVAKTGDADFAGAIGAGFEPQGGRDHIFGHLLAVDLAEELAAFVVVAWKTAKRG